MGQSVVDRILDSQGWLDPIGDAAQTVVGGFFRVLGGPGQRLKDLLHGTFLGHPLHPAVTDLPIGAWLAGVVADWVAVGTPSMPTRAGDIALIVGLLGAVASVMSGYTDFHETYGHERRVALSHGLIMTLVVALEAASLGVRWGCGPELHLVAVILASLGVALMLGGAYLGGHLTFGLGTMVNRGAFLDMPQDYVGVGTPADFPEGKLCRVEAGNLAVLMVRLKDGLYAIANTCSHAGGPLDEGMLDGDTVICPWHASRFCVRDGAVKGGPATFPQAELLVREREGVVEVKPAVVPH